MRALDVPANAILRYFGLRVLPRPLADGLFVRVPDADAPQELSVFRRIDCEICTRRVRVQHFLSKTHSPTLRERHNHTQVLLTPLASPMDHEVVRRQETDPRYVLRPFAAFAGQRQSAVFYFTHFVFCLSAFANGAQSDGDDEADAWLNSFSRPTPKQCRQLLAIGG